MAGIVAASDQVSAGADQVASTAETLSHGAMKQTDSVEELLGTVSNMSAEAKEIAQLTEQVKGVVNEAAINFRRVASILTV